MNNVVKNSQKHAPRSPVSPPTKSQEKNAQFSAGGSPHLPYRYDKRCLWHIVSSFQCVNADTRARVKHVHVSVNILLLWWPL